MEQANHTGLKRKQGDGEKKARKKTSAVWQYFEKVKDVAEAVCGVNECGEKVNCTGGNTSAMGRHLATKHGIFVGANSRHQSSEPVDVLEDMSRLAAQDGISFNTIAKSETFQRTYMTAHNIKIPTSGSSVRSSVLKYFEKAQANTAAAIAECKRAGIGMSLTLDEWTSGSNRRYMNVNVHGMGQVFNLGLARINGSFTADACRSLLSKKLREFDLNLDQDIVAVITDGASNMKKFGRDSNRKQQLCMSHGLHLAVIEVLYEHSWIQEPEEEHEVSDNDDDDDDGEATIQYQKPEKIPERKEYASLLHKVRSIVRIFHRSPLKAEALAKYDNRKLHLDCRTRWSSLLTMLERFVELKDALRKALIDLNDESIDDVSESEFAAISEIVGVLQPVKLATEALCRKDATLITADAAITFLLDRLDGMPCTLAHEMLSAIKNRVQERRTILSDALSYLHFKTDSRPGHRSGYFNKPTKAAMISTIRDIYGMYTIPENILPENDADVDTQMDTPEADLSLEAQLNLVIQEAEFFKLAAFKNVRESRDPLTREITAFDKTGEKGMILTSVYASLKSIPPSTVESERAFSVSNNFCTKLRTSLKDETLNALVFLKYYFINNKYAAIVKGSGE